MPLRVRFLGKKGELTGRSEVRWASCLPRSAPSWARWQTPSVPSIEDALEEAPCRAGCRGARVKARGRGRGCHHSQANPVQMGHQHPMNQRAATRSRTSSSAWAIRSLDGPEIERGRLQLHAAEHRQRAIPPATAPTPSISTDDDSVLLRTQTSPMQIRVDGRQQKAAHPHAGPRPRVTARTRPTPRTPRCSIRSRALSSTRASRWQTSRARWRR